MEGERTTTQQTSGSILNDYRRQELDAINDLNRLRAISEKIELDKAIIDQIDAQLVRIKNRRFSIAIVGEFKRGKSTLINALLGKEILPSDVSPCSAAINRIVWGYPESAQIVFKGEDGRDGYIKDIELHQLAEYVTKLTPESEERAATVKEAIVRYPIEYCRDNVEIIDTPGLNDVAAMSEVTLAVLPDVSAAILVIMATSPVAQSEAEFLTNQLMIQDLGRVMFVVTRIDEIRRKADQEKVIKTIKQRITETVDERLSQKFGRDSVEYKRFSEQLGAPDVYAVSGLDALEGKLNGDLELEAKSGFPVFETALETFITKTRGAVELQVLYNRIVAASDAILSRLTVEVGAMAMQQEEFELAYAKGMAELDALRQLRQDEARQIDEAGTRARAAIRPMVLGLEQQIKQAAEETIEDTKVTQENVGDAAFAEKLGKQIAAAVQNTMKRVAEDIQMEIEKHLVAEVNRLGGFTAQLHQTITNIEMQFVKSSIGQESQAGRAAVKTVAGTLSGGLASGIIEGYDKGGLAGAAVGGTTGIAATFVGGFALAMLGIPLTWPAWLVVGLVATFAGSKFTDLIYGQKRTEQFKEEYTNSVLQQIETQFRIQRLDIQADQQVEKTFIALKDKIIGEAEAVIEQQRNTLDQLRERKASHATLHQHMQREVEAYTAEVNEIKNRGQVESTRVAALISETIQAEA